MFESVMQTLSLLGEQGQNGEGVKHVSTPYRLDNNTEFAVRFMLSWGQQADIFSF